MLTDQDGDVDGAGNTARQQQKTGRETMRIKSILAGAAIALVWSVGSAYAAEQLATLDGVTAEPMNAGEMDRVTAGGLGLPNGMEVFQGFDNPAPGAFHPNFDRSGTAFDATLGIPVDQFGFGNEGPLSALTSPVISCIGC